MNSSLSSVLERASNYRLFAHLEFDGAGVVDNRHRGKKPVPLVRHKLIAGLGLQDTSMVDLKHRRVIAVCVL